MTAQYLKTLHELLKKFINKVEDNLSRCNSYPFLNKKQSEIEVDTRINIHFVENKFVILFQQ